MSELVLEVLVFGMDVGQPRPETPAMTFDEVSMERSKNFVMALQVSSYFISLDF